ncbi:MAG: hypothetical protein O3B41_05890 [Bacteroidetes bacterium]|nr:hypothetical protein [Bacteroidota bacterium]
MIRPIFLFCACACISIGCGVETQSQTELDSPPDTIRVFIASYFPISDGKIDQSVTGDWGKSLEFTQAKVDSVTNRIIDALEEGSRMHGYKDPQAPKSLVYKIIGRKEFLEPLPTYLRPENPMPMTDYAKIMAQTGGESWVSDQNADEIWIWGYHGGVIDLWESNMSSPYGDISNSDRSLDDLPVLDKTYTLFHYNYQRGAAEAVENHLHQFEAVLNAVDGRDDAAPEEWPNLLFWGKFVGSDTTHHLLDPRRAGWSHYPPNAESDYQWDNSTAVSSDIEDWRPDGSGSFQQIECSRWKCDHLGWFVYWMQNMPGHGNTLTYGDFRLRNWWTFLTQYDKSQRENWKLWLED